MKLNILSTAVAFALAGAALSQSAKAQFVAGNVGGNASDEDLILSFFDNTPTDHGSTTDYELDLGNVDQYLNATSNIPIANVNTDLGTVFSSGYLTNPNLSISILGALTGPTDTNTTPNVPQNSVFVSLSNPLSPVAPGTNSVVGAKVTAVDPIYSPDGLSPAPTDGTTAGSFIVPTANSASFSAISAVDGFTLSQTSATFGASGAPDLYLEELDHGPGSKSTTASTSYEDLLGYFTVTSGGEVEFVAAANTGATPEPSTYALMLLGAGALVWIARRKNATA